MVQKVLNTENLQARGLYNIRRYNQSHDQSSLFTTWFATDLSFKSIVRLIIFFMLQALELTPGTLPYIYLAIILIYLHENLPSSFYRYTKQHMKLSFFFFSFTSIYKCIANDVFKCLANKNPQL